MTKRELTILTVTKGIIITLLLIGMCNMSYGYYQIMRFSAMVLFVFIGWSEWNEEHYLISILCFLSAVVYQPFQKLAFKKDEWREVDGIFVGLLFIWILIDAVIYIRKPKTTA